MSTDPNLPDITDEPGSSVSIYVPDTQDANNPDYTFLRLGKPDIDHETTLPPDPNVPTTAGAGGATSPFDDGLLLYTTGSYSLNAPSVNTFSSDNLTVVKDGDNLLSANLQTKSSPLFFGRAANVTFQNVDQLTVSQGDASNFLNGNSLTFWNGNDQSIGFGGLLWANMGFTSNIFGGEIVNLTNTMATVQAPPGGDYETNLSKEISTVNKVKLNVNPASATWVGRAQTLTAIVNGLLLLTTAVAGTYSLSELVQTDPSLINPDALQPDHLKNRMTQTNEDLEIMTMLVVGVQAASIILGAGLQIAAAAVADAIAVSKLNLGEAGALLEAGIAPAASTLVMTPDLVGLSANDPLGGVSISAGGATPTGIQLGVGQIILAAGETTYIAVNGITETITLVAGETSIEIGMLGIAMNGMEIQGNTPMTLFGPDPMPPAPLSPLFDETMAAVVEEADALRGL